MTSRYIDTKNENLHTGENYVNQAMLMHRCNLMQDEQRTSLKCTFIYTATGLLYQYQLVTSFPLCIPSFVCTVYNFLHAIYS